MIRRYQPHDLPFLLQLFDQAIDFHHAIRPNAFQASNRRAQTFLRDMLKKPHVLCLVKEVGGVIQAYLLASLRPVQDHPIIPEQIMIQLEEIYVVPEARRQGIATELMEALHREADILEADIIELMVWEGNDEAMAFYKSLGYTLRASILEKIR